MSLRAFFRRPAVLLVLALCVLAAAMTLLGRLAGGRRAADKPAALSEGAGVHATPAFSPDGRRLAYSARGSSKEDTFHLWTRRLPNGTARQLTEGAADDVSAVWSPDGGSLAFVRVTEGKAECKVMPAEGGVIGTVANCRPHTGLDAGRAAGALAWTRDGRSLVVAQEIPGRVPALAVIELESGKVRALTEPPQGSEGDSIPAVSPDDGTVAFVRSAGDDGDIWLCDLSGGNLRQATFDGLPVRGIAWTPDGQELIYARDRGSGSVLRRIPAAGGVPRDLGTGGNQAFYPAVAPAGGRMVYVDARSTSAIWLAPLGERGEKGERGESKPLIRSSGQEFGPSYSPDGTRIADISDQTGHDEIWVSDSKGGQRVRITDLGGPKVFQPRWSPDGRILLFDGRAQDSTEVYTVQADAPNGPVKPARVALGNGASWSHDGKSILFQARGQIWRANPDGGNPRPVAKERDANWPFESLDGKYVYFRKQIGIWRVPAEGGTPEVVIPPANRVVWPLFQPVKDGFYYTGFSLTDRGMSVMRYDTARQQSETAFRLAGSGRQRTGFSVSPDGRWILYPREDQSETRLMVVDGFR